MLMLDVLVMMNVIMLMLMMKVKGLVTVKVVLEVKVVVKVFEEVLLFSFSSPSTPPPRTRPAARVWASGAKGLGFQFAAPAPGRRCSGPFS